MCPTAAGPARASEQSRRQLARQTHSDRLLKLVAPHEIVCADLLEEAACSGRVSAGCVAQRLPTACPVDGVWLLTLDLDAPRAAVRMASVKVLGLALALLAVGRLPGEVLDAHGDAALECIGGDDVRLLCSRMCVSGGRGVRRCAGSSPRS